MAYKYNVISDVARYNEYIYIEFFLIEKDAIEFYRKYKKASTISFKKYLLKGIFEDMEQCDEWIEKFSGAIPKKEQAWTGYFETEEECNDWYEEYGKLHEKQGYKLVKRKVKQQIIIDELLGNTNTSTEEA